MQFRTIFTLILILVVVIVAIIFFITGFGGLTTPTEELAGSPGTRTEEVTGGIEGYGGIDTSTP